MTWTITITPQTIVGGLYGLVFVAATEFGIREYRRLGPRLGILGGVALLLIGWSILTILLLAGIGAMEVSV
jgi:hypothetical protein